MQAKKLMMSEKIHKSFTQIVIEGKGTNHIIETLYGILNRNGTLEVVSCPLLSYYSTTS